jgi:hypothetical protein
MKLNNIKELNKNVKNFILEKASQIFLVFYFVPIVQYVRYGLDERGIRCLILGRGRDLSTFHTIRAASESDPVFCAKDSFPRGNAAEMWSLPLTFM